MCTYLQHRSVMLICNAHINTILNVPSQYNDIFIKWSFKNYNYQQKCIKSFKCKSYVTKTYCTQTSTAALNV